MSGILWNEMINEYRLARPNIKGKSFVMVEGKTDRALWTEYMPSHCSYLVYADGKNEIVDTLNAPVMRGVKGIAGIVDLDYWLITEADELGMENLLYDDRCPDSETMLLNSPALKKFLRNHCYNLDIDKIHQFADKLVGEAQRLAAEFGYFRLLNHCQDYGIKFEDFDLSAIIDADTLELDREWAAKKLAEEKDWISYEDLLSGVDELKAKYPTGALQLCQGHDFISILAYLLPRLFKLEFGKALPADLKSLQDRQLSASLRTAYEYDYFRETSLFGCIRQWESDNLPYRIIRDFPHERTSP